MGNINLKASDLNPDNFQGKTLLSPLLLQPRTTPEPPLTPLGCKYVENSHGYDDLTDDF